MGEDGTNIDKLQIEIGVSSSDAAKRISALEEALQKLKDVLGGKWSNPVADLANASEAEKAAAAIEKQAEAVENLKEKTGKSDKRTIFANATAESIMAEQRVDILQNKVALLQKSLTEAFDKGKGDKTLNSLALQLNNAKSAYNRENNKEAVAAAKAIAAAEKEKAKAAKAAERAEKQRVKAAEQAAKAAEREAAFAAKQRALIESADRKMADHQKMVEQKQWNSFQTAIEGVGRAITNTTKGLSKFAVSVAKIGGNVLTAPFRNMARSVTNAYKAFQNYTRSIGRILMYRAIRTLIKELGDAIKEGTNNLYQYSAVMGTKFKPALDQMATAMLYIKNASATMFAPLIEVAAPIIDQLSDKVALLFDRVAELMAALAGKSEYSSAIKYATEYAEATEAAAKAAKLFLLPFDEINKMSAASGSGNKADLDYSKMFVEAAVDDPISHFLEVLMGSIRAGNWIGVRTELASKLNEILPSAESFEEWGRDIGYKITNALKILNTVFTAIPFKKLGEDFNKGLKGLFDGLDGNEIGKALTLKFNAAIDFLAGALSDSETFKKVGKVVGEAIKGFFTNIDIDGIKEILSGLVGAAGELITGFFEGLGFDTSKLEKSFRDLASAVEPFIDAASGALKVLVPLGKWTIEKALPKSVDLATYSIMTLTYAIRVFYSLGKAVVDFLNGDFKGAWDNLKQAANLSDEFHETTKGFLGFVQSIVNGAIAGINLVIAAINHIPGVQVEPVPTLDLASTMSSGHSGSFGSDTGANKSRMTTNDLMLAAWEQSRRTLGDGLGAGTNNSADNAAVVDTLQELITVVANKDTTVTIEANGMAKAMYDPLRRQEALHGKALVN